MKCLICGAGTQKAFICGQGSTIAILCKAHEKEFSDVVEIKLPTNRCGNCNFLAKCCRTRSICEQDHK